MVFYEPGSSAPACVGGILYDGEGQALRFFSSVLEHEILAGLTVASKHPIYEIELAAVLISMEAWS